MSKKILFLYSDVKYKNEISKCEGVLRAALRKFRKTAVFSYQYVDMSPYMQDKSASDIISQAHRYDAVIWQGGKDSLCDERLFATSCLGAFAQEYFIGSRCICSPLFKLTATQNEERIFVQSEFSSHNVAKTVSLALSRAKGRSLILSADKSRAADKFILQKFENALGQAAPAVPQYRDFDEMVLDSIYRIPSFDVLMTTEECARVITLHLSSLQRVPCGSVLWHTENARIHRRDILPHEDMTNSACASFLMACADAFCDDLDEKSAGDRLRRSTALALEQYVNADCSDFLNEVIRQINAPMRNRQVKPDDSTN